MDGKGGERGEGREADAARRRTRRRKAGRKEKRERHARAHETTGNKPMARGGFARVLMVSYSCANGDSLRGAETAQKENQGLKKGPEEPVDKNKRVRHQ